MKTGFLGFISNCVHSQMYNERNLLLSTCLEGDLSRALSWAYLLLPIVCSQNLWECSISVTQSLAESLSNVV